MFIPSKAGALCCQQLLHACLDSRIGTPWMSPGCSSGAEGFSSPFCLAFLFSLWFRIRQNKLHVCFQVSSTKSDRLLKQILDFSRKEAQAWTVPINTCMCSMRIYVCPACWEGLRPTQLRSETQQLLFTPPILLPLYYFGLEWFLFLLEPSSSLTQTFSLFLCPNHTGEPSPARGTMG